MIYSNLIRIPTLFDKFHLRAKFRPDGLSLSIIMAKVHVFIVFKLMMSSDSLYSRKLSKTENEFKKFGVVHRRGSRGSPWTGCQNFQLSPGPQLLKSGMTRNQPKRPKTGRNHLKPVLPTLKPAETSPSHAQLS